MMDILKLKSKPWWSYLTENQRDLLEQTSLLLEREEAEAEVFHDYAFIVFPAAKAYEGFLKKLFFDLKLITREDYEGKEFRIGKSLNPSLPKKYRDKDWVWIELCKRCGGEQLPRFLWKVWKESRNFIFHWWPKHENFITLQEARKRVNMVVEAIEKAFEGCPLNGKATNSS